MPQLLTIANVQGVAIPNVFIEAGLERCSDAVGKVLGDKLLKILDWDAIGTGELHAAVKKSAFPLELGLQIGIQGQRGHGFLIEQSKQENNRNYLLTQKGSRVSSAVFLKEGIEMHTNHELNDKKISSFLTEVDRAEKKRENQNSARPFNDRHTETHLDRKRSSRAFEWCVKIENRFPAF